jgi:hypothetical protein
MPGTVLGVCISWDSLVASDRNPTPIQIQLNPKGNVMALTQVVKPQKHSVTLD